MDADQLICLIEHNPGDFGAFDRLGKTGHSLLRVHGKKHPGQQLLMGCEGFLGLEAFRQHPPYFPIVENQLLTWVDVLLVMIKKGSRPYLVVLGNTIQRFSRLDNVDPAGDGQFCLVEQGIHLFAGNTVNSEPVIALKKLECFLGKVSKDLVNRPRFITKVFQPLLQFAHITAS